VEKDKLSECEKFLKIVRTNLNSKKKKKEFDVNVTTSVIKHLKVTRVDININIFFICFSIVFILALH